jgi:hypothetical protein
MGLSLCLICFFVSKLAVGVDMRAGVHGNGDKTKGGKDEKKGNKTSSVEEIGTAENLKSRSYDHGLLKLLGTKSFVPGYLCQICEDVAETFRDTNKCRGIDGDEKETNHDGEEASPRAQVDLTPCKPPHHCTLWKDQKKRDKCSSLQRAWRQDKQILDIVYNRHPPLQSCIQLGMCREEQDTEGEACAYVLNSNECRDDMNCDSSKCPSDDCMACYWLVKTWPMFGEICTPGGNKNPPKGGMTSKDFYRSALRAKGSPSLSRDSPSQKILPNPATLSNECYEMWDRFVFSPKARYMISYVNQLGVAQNNEWGATAWDANTVCKCLSECAYDEYQAPQVEQACRGNALVNQPGVLSSLFPDLGEEQVHNKQKTQNIHIGAKDKEEAKEWWNHGN